MPDNHIHALPVGNRLREYEILRVLGVGGFGITYQARDTNLQRNVAIKEYFPSELAGRDGTSSRIVPRSQKQESLFVEGVTGFIEEARAIARFSHPNIVRVLNFFSANGTAYFVMEFIEGESLQQLIKRQGTPMPEAQLEDILREVLEGLKVVHEQGMLHRDIKPDNIYLPKHGPAILIDFGAARYAVGKATKSLSLVLTEGYAPYEQYQSDGRRQGPWTDLYALAGTLYTCITGKVPPKAPDRAGFDDEPDPFQPVSQLAAGQYKTGLLNAIDAAMTFSFRKRPQTLEAFETLIERVPRPSPPPPAQQSETADAEESYFEEALSADDIIEFSAPPEPPEYMIQQEESVPPPPPKPKPKATPKRVKAKVAKPKKAPTSAPNARLKNIAIVFGVMILITAIWNISRQPATSTSGNTTPPVEEKRPSLSNANVRDFVERYVSVANAGNIFFMLNMYHDRVKFYDKGFVSKTYIEKDKLNYYKRWPIVNYRLDGGIDVRSGSSQNSRRAVFKINFLVRNDAQNRQVRGQAESQLEVRLINGELKIVAESQIVLKRVQ